MRFSRFLKLFSLFVVLALLPAWAQADNPSTANSRSARPGEVNYVEGQVSLDNQTLDEKSVGSTEVDAGQSLTTENGKAEVLLTPGVFQSLAMGSSTVLLAGASTHHFTSTVRRALAMDTDASIITSTSTTTIGALALTIRPIPGMRLGCTLCQTPQLIISVLLPRRASVVLASTPAHAAW